MVDTTIPDISFEPLITQDQAKAIVQEALPSFREQMLQVVLLACLDRKKMDKFFSGLDEADQIHTLKVASDTCERARELSNLVDAVFHRVMVSAGAACNMLSEEGAA